MSYEIIIQHEALQDIQTTYAWYEEQLPGLGEDFLNELDACFEKLRKNPQHYSYTFDDFRDVRLKRFPYLIVFRLVQSIVYINAVKHQKRKPKK